MLVGLREELRGIRLVTMHHVRTIDLEELRKMVEVIFRDGDTEVEIYTTRTPQARADKREFDSYAMVVDGGKTEYRDILAKVRPVLQDSGGEGAIRGMKSTREGKLLITLNKDRGAYERVKEKIESLSGNIKTRLMGNKERLSTVYIRGMDELTTVEEVKEALAREVGAGEKFEVGNIRVNARNTRAVTVNLGTEAADRLIKAGRIRVGVVRYPIFRRINVPCCRKCSSYEHLAKDCNGVEKQEERCYRCNGVGHYARECKSESVYCPACKREGHKRGTSGCPAFVRALALRRDGVPALAAKASSDGVVARLEVVDERGNQGDEGPGRNSEGSFLSDIIG